MPSAIDVCIVSGCTDPATATRRCARHTRRFRLHGVTGVASERPGRCAVLGCGEASFASGYCLVHHVRLLRMRERQDAVRARSALTKSMLFAAGQVVKLDRRGRPKDLLAPDGTGQFGPAA